MEIRLTITRVLLASLFLASVSASLLRAADATPVQVGVSSLDITPDWQAKPVWIAGFGMGRQAKGVHSPICARAMVLKEGDRKIGMVCLDVVGLMNTRVEKIKALLPDYEYVMVSSNHNHEGPDTMGIWGKDPLHPGTDPEYMDFISKKSAEAIRKAEEHAAPVKAYLGMSDASPVLADSRTPEARNARFYVLSLKKDDGKLHGMVVFWANHPEALGGRNPLLSSDIVGGIISELKKDYDCPIAYFTGSVGGLMTPLHVKLKMPDGSELGDGNIPFLDEYSRRSAAYAKEAIAGQKPVNLGPIGFKNKRFTIPIDNKKFVAAFAIMNMTGTSTGHSTFGMMKNPKTTTEAARIRAGDMEFTCVPGEYYPELEVGGIEYPQDPGADIQGAPHELPLLIPPSDRIRITIGLANDELGYIIPKSQWDEKAPYCYGRDRDQYGEENSIGPEAGRFITAALQMLADEWRMPTEKRLTPERVKALADARATLKSKRKTPESPLKTTRVQIAVRPDDAVVGEATFRSIAQAAGKTGTKTVIFANSAAASKPEVPSGVVGGVNFVPGVATGDKMVLGPSEASADASVTAAFTGVEGGAASAMRVYGVAADMGEKSSGEGFLAAVKAAGGGIEAFSAFCDYPIQSLREWDSANRRSDAIVPGIAVNDWPSAAGGKPAISGTEAFEMNFSLVGNHVYADSEKTAVTALARGKGYIGFDWLCPTDGFAVWVDDGKGKTALPGDSIAVFENKNRLHVKSPLPCYLRLMLNGSVCWEEQGNEISTPLRLPGKYRVEAFVKVADDWYPWVIANPIKVTGLPAGIR
ncbi:MAG TPA: hypothetical protein PL033_13695 [Candidatus Brocadiia bacterium]|nr:hypothetical protein [Candidatus Brocadiia bacterium]